MAAAWNASHAWDSTSNIESFNTSHVWDAASALSLLDPPPTSRDEARVRLVALYQHGIESGRFKTFVLPYWILHLILFALYFILVPPSWLDEKVAHGSAWRRARRCVLLHAKYPLFLLFVWRAVAMVYMCRSPTGHIGYKIGVCSTFSVWWMAALFIFREPRFDCMRLEKAKISLDASSAPVQKNQASTTTGALGGSEVHLRRRKPEQQSREECLDECRVEYRYYWQGLPPTLGHRAAWILDLMTSVRGAGWTHQVRTLPAPPPEALAQLPPSSPRFTSKLRRRGFEGPDARARLLRHNLITIAVAYLILDVFRSVLVMHDPYFSGLVDAPFPPGLLPRILSESPIFVRGLRTVASGSAVVFSIMFTFTTEMTLLLVCKRPDELKAEPWIWNDTFGNPRAVLDHGLAGLWGETWHQAMRITLSAPGDAISASCGWAPRDWRAQATNCMMAFLISGSLHAAGSYASLGHTRPMKQFVFFALQGLGILFETLVGSVCARRGWRLPERYMRVVRGAWVAVFFVLTGHLFADDYASGGEWLSEPVPFSLVRSLRFGSASAPGAGWGMWHGPLMWWHKGDVWWKSGFAM